MDRCLILVALMVSALCCQGCFLTAAMWERRSERVELSAERQMVIGATQQDERQLAIDLHTVEADRDDPLASADVHRLVVSLRPGDAALLHPVAGMGAMRPELDHLQQASNAWRADLVLAGEAPISALGEVLPVQVAIAYAGAPRMDHQVAASDEMIARLAELVAPEAGHRRFVPLAWTHRDLSPCAGDEGEPHAIAERRLLLRGAGDPPLVIVLTGAALALDPDEVRVTERGLAWRRARTARGELTGLPSAPLPPGDARAVTIGWVEHRETAFYGWGLAGRVMATPITVAADIVLFTGYVMLRASLESGC